MGTDAAKALRERGAHWLAQADAVDAAGSMMVLGSSLATYSAWRLVKRAKEQGKPIAIVNMGGVRGEEAFFVDISADNDGAQAVRCSLPLEETLPALVDALNADTKECIVK